MTIISPQTDEGRRSLPRSRLDPSQAVLGLLTRLGRLQYEGVEQIPTQGPALLVANHRSPMDFFYAQALMERAGRHTYRCIIAAELLHRQAFLPYTRDALRDKVPYIGPYLGWLALFLSHVVPPIFQSLNPIPVYRTGDDAESRRLSLESLLNGELLILAPGRSRERNAKGLRSFTHGAAAIARRYFEAAGEGLAIVPVGVNRLAGVLPGALLRVGPPYRGMSDLHYPELFSEPGRSQSQVKHQAYTHFTRELEQRVMDLL